jgi:hypothetical protein
VEIPSITCAGGTRRCKSLRPARALVAPHRRELARAAQDDQPGRVLGDLTPTKSRAHAAPMSSSSLSSVTSTVMLPSNSAIAMDFPSKQAPGRGMADQYGTWGRRASWAHAPSVTFAAPLLYGGRGYGFVRGSGPRPHDGGRPPTPRRMMVCR